MTEESTLYYNETTDVIKRYDLVEDLENNDFGIVATQEDDKESNLFLLNEDDDCGSEVYCAWFRTKETALKAFNHKTKKINKSFLSIYGYSRVYTEKLKLIKRLGVSSWKELLSNKN